MKKIAHLTVSYSLLLGLLVCFVGCGSKYKNIDEAIRLGTVEDVKYFVEKKGVNVKEYSNRYE